MQNLKIALYSKSQKNAVEYIETMFGGSLIPGSKTDYKDENDNTISIVKSKDDMVSIDYDQVFILGSKMPTKETMEQINWSLRFSCVPDEYKVQLITLPNKSEEN